MAVWGSGKSPAPEHPPPPPPAYQPLRSHPHPLPAVPAVDAHTRVSQKAVARAVTQAMPAMANSGHARQSFRTRWYLRILDTRLPANSPAIRSTGMTGRLRDSPGATGRRSKLPRRSSPDEARGPQCEPRLGAHLSPRGSCHVASSHPLATAKLGGLGLCRILNRSTHKSCFALVIPRVTATIGTRAQRPGGIRGALPDEIITGCTFEKTS
jgi:hypothetical protein